MSMYRIFKRRMSTFRTIIEQKRESPLIGMMINMTDPTSTDAMCNCCDFLWFDMEHCPFSPEVLRTHIMVARGRQTATVVRIPGPNYIDSSMASMHGAFVKHTLDANADGIILPQVRCAQDVESFILDCKYPNGQNRGYRRGFGPTIPSNYGQIPVDEYVETANENTMIGVTVETKEAVDDIDRICSLDELDFVVIGTMDLSGSHGVPYSVNIGSEIVKGAVDEVIRSAKKHNKYVMYSPANHKNMDFVKDLVSKGVDMVLTGSDVMALVDYQSNLCRRIRETTNEQSINDFRGGSDARFK